jgi:hypothetical protein
LKITTAKTILTYFKVTALAYIIYVYFPTFIHIPGAGIATGYRVNGRGSIPGRDEKFLSTPNRLRCPTSFLFNGYGSYLPGGKATEA